jgi:acyl-CoA dehydrogenase
MWATAVHVADYVLVLARTENSERKRDGVTLFLVPRAANGFQARQIPKLGMRALSSCEDFLMTCSYPMTSSWGRQVKAGRC